MPCFSAMRAHLFIQAFVIRAAAVFDAQGRVELIRLLTFADDRHIHRDQLRHIRSGMPAAAP
jgi:hypothetical protein